MPELPDVEVYVECLADRILGEPLVEARILGPSLLRSVEPPPSAAVDRRVEQVQRLGKRIVIGFEGGLFLVFHLMVAGRFRWRPPGARVPRRGPLAWFRFQGGTLLLTEAGSKRRATLDVVGGAAALAAHDRGGLEVLDASRDEFGTCLRRENHTLKRSLTDPRILSGIGNAYSDEILHRARLSPVKLTQRLGDDEIDRLHRAARDVLTFWTERLRDEAAGGFPEKVTAFRPGMAVHGRYREPCPDCGSPVQRIVYASNETNYCATCQTGGRLLADRALSRLLHRDWPKTLEALEARRAGDPETADPGSEGTRRSR